MEEKMIIFLNLNTFYKIQNKFLILKILSKTQKYIYWVTNTFLFIYIYIHTHCCCYVTSVVSNSVRPHRWQPTRLPRPWDSPGENTGVGCHFLLQCMKVKSENEVVQSYPTLSDPMNCSLPGSSVHGILQARVLEWGAIAFSNIKATVLNSLALCYSFSSRFVNTDNFASSFAIYSSHLFPSVLIALT